MTDAGRLPGDTPEGPRNAEADQPGPSPEPIRVGLVEDDKSTLAAFAAAISAADNMVLAMVAERRDDALRQLGSHGLDVLLVDLGLPDGSGLDVIAMATTVQPACAVMVITIFGDETNVLNAIEAGATGYLLKRVGPSQVADEIRSLHAGGSPISPMVARKILMRSKTAGSSPDEAGVPLLSPRQIDVLKLIARGHTSDEAAAMLGMSKHTVLTYVRRIYKKLGVSSRAQAADAARRMGLLHDA